LDEGISVLYKIRHVPNRTGPTFFLVRKVEYLVQVV